MWVNLVGVPFVILINSSNSAICHTCANHFVNDGGVVLPHLEGMQRVAALTRCIASELWYVDLGREEWRRRYCEGVKSSV